MANSKKQSTEAAVRTIRRRTRRKFSPEEKLRALGYIDALSEEAREKANEGASLPRRVDSAPDGMHRGVLPIGKPLLVEGESLANVAGQAPIASRGGEFESFAGVAHRAIEIASRCVGDRESVES